MKATWDALCPSCGQPCVWTQLTDFDNAGRSASAYYFEGCSCPPQLPPPSTPSLPSPRPSHPFAGLSSSPSPQRPPLSHPGFLWYWLRRPL